MHVYDPRKVFEKFPTIELDDELILRQYDPSDQEDYFEYLSDADVLRFVPEECIPETMDRAAEEVQYVMDLFHYQRSVYWALALKKNNKLIGSCGFNYWNRDHYRTEISYDLAREYWGRGIITKAAKAVLTFGFTHMHLHRVEATIVPDNIGSVRVVEKLGFKYEGLLREQKMLHGEFKDANVYSILSHEFLGV